ncbi:hypothetical protein B0H17DRAFT_1195088 [Mycena rosella]|uniref:Uncharacterized protein n=1 Tax=Mycena rosella TaxID=1033263 RepID=A0AAD7E066_MYCRO|nr:hypothetical protein B0H17DRAFT_1195088 [Mycena rosella]
MLHSLLSTALFIASDLAILAKDAACDALLDMLAPPFEEDADDEMLELAARAAVWVKDALYDAVYPPLDLDIVIDCAGPGFTVPEAPVVLVQLEDANPALVDGDGSPWQHSSDSFNREEAPPPLHRWLASLSDAGSVAYSTSSPLSLSAAQWFLIGIGTLLLLAANLLLRRPAAPQQPQPQQAHPQLEAVMIEEHATPLLPPTHDGAFLLQTVDALLDSEARPRTPRTPSKSKSSPVPPQAVEARQPDPERRSRPVSPGTRSDAGAPLAATPPPLSCPPDSPPSPSPSTPTFASPEITAVSTPPPRHKSNPAPNFNSNPTPKPRPETAALPRTAQIARRLLQLGAQSDAELRVLEKWARVRVEVGDVHEAEKENDFFAPAAGAGAGAGKTTMWRGRRWGA